MTAAATPGFLPAEKADNLVHHCSAQRLHLQSRRQRWAGRPAHQTGGAAQICPWRTAESDGAEEHLRLYTGTDSDFHTYIRKLHNKSTQTFTCISAQMWGETDRTLLLQRFINLPTLLANITQNHFFWSFSEENLTEYRKSNPDVSKYVKKT